MRADVAMTGEITLRGKVLPIGGLKEKLLAAHRGGIKTVVIPEDNEKDLVEIPKAIRKKIEVIPVSTIDEVLKQALTEFPEQEDQAVEVGKPAAPTVNWDDSEMRTSYANVVNAASTREEVTLFFGTNLTWNPNDAEQFDIKLHDRVVVNPHAAKRLWVLLGAVLREYERRFGEIKIDGLSSAAPMAGGGQAAGKDS